jgi:hypothetical protein
METAGCLSDRGVGSFWRSLRDRRYSNVRANDKPVSGKMAQENCKLWTAQTEVDRHRLAS